MNRMQQQQLSGHLDSSSSSHTPAEDDMKGEERKIKALVMAFNAHPVREFQQGDLTMARSMVSVDDIRNPFFLCSLFFLHPCSVQGV